MKPNRNRTRDLGFYLVMIVIFIAIILSFTKDTQSQELKYSDLVELFTEERVQSFEVKGNQITMKVRADKADSAETDTTESDSESSVVDSLLAGTAASSDGTKLVRCKVYDFSVFYSDFHDLIWQQKVDGIIEEYNYTEGSTVSIVLMSLLPYVLIIVVSMAAWYFIMKRAGGGDMTSGIAKFSKARTRLGADEKDKKTFADVAGCDEEKEDLAEIVDFLRDPKAYTNMGARIPKGVLLVGPPGTGKTLLAKAVAGEAGVQFLSISGSDFVEMYVGVGAGRVRDLFEQAKKAAPAIVFIDEIDAVGRQRGSGLGGGHDEREQTLNQLLVEMDGFGSNEGVIVMAATNRADILDNALLRPGRFDRQIYVGLPDIKGREAILKIHSRGKPLGDDVDLNSIAKGTPGFSGADLENLMNEAALLAVRRRHRFIAMADIDEAILKVQMGPEKKSRKMSDKARRLTAYHEAGHAVVIHELKTQDPVHQITIIPRGPAGGLTISLPEEDRMYQSRKELQERICTCLGGRVAEELVLGDISTGASNDLQTATSIARSMVMKYGMSDRLGAISYDNDQEVFIGRSMSQARAYSEEIAGLIDEEIKALLDTAYARCRQILSENMDALERTAQYLLEFETMSADDFKLVFDDPDALEQRKAEERTQREREESERAAKEARLKAEREAERQRQQEVAEAIFQGEPPKDQKPPQTPDPF